ncbi:hypothetical protein VI26_08435 [Chromobacterium sp. LK1]|nr:hypothetical protein VI26_08435 [Chromobacterium sp. LK1]
MLPAYSFRCAPFWSLTWYEPPLLLVVANSLLFSDLAADLLEGMSLLDMLRFVQPLATGPLSPE